MSVDPTRQQVDLQEIQQLKARYFRFLDTKDWDAWRELFTVEFHGEAEGNVFRGREEFVSGVSGLLTGVTTVHHGHMPEIEITGADTARGVWAMEDVLVFPSDGAPQGFRGYGHYHEDYRRVDGHWRIDRLVLTRLHIAALEGGLPAAMTTAPAEGD